MIKIQLSKIRDRDGRKVYTTDVVIENQEFCESRNASSSSEHSQQPSPDAEGYMDFPDGIDAELPFN